MEAAVSQTKQPLIPVVPGTQYKDGKCYVAEGLISIEGSERNAFSAATAYFSMRTREGVYLRLQLSVKVGPNYQAESGLAKILSGLCDQSLEGSVGFTYKGGEGKIVNYLCFPHLQPPLEVFLHQKTIVRGCIVQS